MSLYRYFDKNRRENEKGCYRDNCYGNIFKQFIETYRSSRNISFASPFGGVKFINHFSRSEVR